MHDEMKTEAMEVCATACEKFASSNEVEFKNLIYFLILIKLTNLIYSIKRELLD